MRQLVVAALLSLIAQPVAGACPGQVIAGYYSSWSIYARDYQVEDIDAARLSHILYAFANIDGATGTCVLGDPWADVDQAHPGDCWDAGCLRGNFNALRQLKASQPDLRILISIGGWTWSEHFPAVAATPAARARFVSSCVDLFLKGEFGGTYGTHADVFDGIDVDWEFPVAGGLFPGRPSDRADHAALLAEFRLQMDQLETVTGRDYELSIAAGASPAQRAGLDLAALSDSLDHLQIMAYDLHGAWDPTTNFNAPLFASANDPGPPDLYVDAAIQGYLAAGWPAAKLVVGVPFYGRSWSGVSGGGDGLYATASGPGPGTWESGIVDFADVARNYLTDPSYVRFNHPEAEVPWLFDGDTFVSFDGPGTIARKAAHARDNGLAGVMLWELNGDLRGVPAPAGSLLAALAGTLCPSAPGRINDLRMVRDGQDLLYAWTPDPGAEGGYHLYRTATRSEVSLMRLEHPAYDPFLALAAADPLPAREVGGMLDGRAYYQVLGVAADRVSEGPN